MTVEKLIEELKKFDPKAYVFADQEYDEKYIVNETVSKLDISSGKNIVLLKN